MNYESNQYQNLRVNSPSGRTINKNKFNNNNNQNNNPNYGNLSNTRDVSLNKKYHSCSINPVDRHKTKK